MGGVCSSGGVAHAREGDGLLPLPTQAGGFFASKSTPVDDHLAAEDYSEHGQSVSSPTATREVQRGRGSERGSTIGWPDALSVGMSI